jgi:hypothetical protein
MPKSLKYTPLENGFMIATSSLVNAMLSIV